MPSFRNEQPSGGCYLLRLHPSLVLEPGRILCMDYTEHVILRVYFRKFTGFTENSGSYLTGRNLTVLLVFSPLA